MTADLQTTPPFTAPAIQRGHVLRDAAVAAAALALTIAVMASRANGTRSLDVLGVVLALVASVPLLAHRRAPLAVFVITAAASATLNALGYALGPPFGATVALFYVADEERSHARIRQTAAAVIAVFVGHVASATIGRHGFPTSPVLFGILVWGGAWVVGDQVRQRRVRRVDLAERLRRAERDTERERRLAAAEERTRIARDLHDSAAHAINVILVQAGAARLLQERSPQAAQEALSTIEDVARETISEIDQLVRNLRDANSEELHAIEPPTGLAGLSTLVSRYQATGLAITMQTDGTQRTLPRGVDQAAYRILQESLTNAARHGCGSAQVHVHYGAAELELTISNRVAPGVTGGDGGGHGILGMRERAALLGGTIDAAQRGDEFHVVARLPYVDEAR